MGDLSHYNQPIKGIDTDKSILNTTSTDYSFALNAVIEDRAGHGIVLQNEMSNICSVEFPHDYIVIGFVEIPEQHRTIYALVNVNSKTPNSQIGESIDCQFKGRTDRIKKTSCKDCPEYTSPELTPWESLEDENCYCQYYNIVGDECLNFNIHYPVDIEYKITDCGINIYFTDFLNERRYLYFDYTDKDNSNSLLKVNDNFKISTTTIDEEQCSCPDEYILNEQHKTCTKVMSTPMQSCSGEIITVDGLNYCQTVEIVNPDCSPCSCPTGFLLNTITNQCAKVTKTPLVPSGTQRIACSAKSDAYTNFGVKLYSSYTPNGVGTNVVYHTTDPYWSNPTNSTSIGKLNSVALWACGNPQNGSGKDVLPVNEYIGFILPIEIAQSKTYYIGIAGDNRVRIRVDCSTAVDMDPDAMGHSRVGGTVSDAFKFWHIYPVTIPAGHHVIELTGLSWGKDAGFGAEIYDNTAQDIINSNDGSNLNIIFSTKDKIGQPLQVSSSFSGTCPDGSCLDADSLGNLICTKTLIAESICPPCTCKTGYTLDAATNKCKRSVQTPLGFCDGEVSVVGGIEYCTKTIVVNAICTDCPSTTIADKLDCDKLLFHSIYDRPCVEFEAFINGGGLKEGTYQVIIGYADKQGNPIAEYFPASQTMPLFEDTIKFETNNKTNKAIKINISNLKVDNQFQYYNVVIVSTIDQFTTFTLAATLPTTQRTYVYTGNNPSPHILTPQDVLFTRPYYELARGITSANKYLMFTGLKEYKTLNLQPVANKVKLNWQTVAIKEDGYSDPRNTFYFHTYQRDEVYAFAIEFIYDNGLKTCRFHIPGRASIPSDLDIIDNADVISDIDCNTSIRNRRWQVYNTGKLLGGDYQYNETCDVDKCWEYGDFAYWESTTLYPNIPEIWGDLSCKPIRHHKFPDSCITHIHDGSIEEKTYTDNNYIFPIGVQIDHQSVLDALTDAVNSEVITESERQRIVGYRILRGNRVGNKSITAKGLLFNMFKYEKFDETYYFPNYVYNDLHADAFLNGTSLAPERYTFHSPDTHFVNSALGNILKIETEEFGKSDGYFTHSECQAKEKILSDFAHTLAFGLGLASAISATGEKECKVVTYHANDIEKTYDVSSTGKTPVSNVHTGLLGLISGTGRISTSFKSKSWSANSKVPDVIVTHDNKGYTTFDKDTNKESKEADSKKGASEQITTCKGTPYQIFNDPTSPVNLLLSSIPGIPGVGKLAGKFGKITQRFFLGLIEMNKVMDTLRQLIPYYNYGVQYNSVGKYNNYTCSAEGNKVRKLDKSAYLNPIIQTIDEITQNPKTPFSTIKVNNWNRESSVYLKTSSPLANPTNIDFSKVSMRNIGFGVDDLNKKFQREISSYYVSVKNQILDQYGSICDIDYVETNSCTFFLNTTYDSCEAKVFGGDTFINRFAIKRKMPFFQHTMCNMANGSDVIYNKLFNAAEPKYWYNTPQPLFERIDDIGIGLGLLNSIFSDNQHHPDVRGNGNIRFYRDGYIHLFNYGIPYFLVESDINVSYRHGQNNKDKDFYPHNTDLKEWLEEANTPISADNTFFYNRTYSKQDKESVGCTSCVLDYDKFVCQPIKRNRLIYSEQDTLNGYNDNWLIFKANNYYDFDLKLGRLISADGIEDSKILARLEKGSKLFPAYNTLLATDGNIQVGTGGMFKSHPQDIAVTKLGYGGTQHRGMLSTEFGHIWCDANGGQVFNLAPAGGIKELTTKNIRNWFKENLPFYINKQFPGIDINDIDNNFFGIGLHFCFDKRFSRILLTKLDYEAIDKSVYYDESMKRFMLTGKNTEVSIYNTKYFCNKSWTMSYSFLTNEWVSYHSYKPNFYVQRTDSFDSSFIRLGQQKTYTHNITNKSYQVFYGRLFPFIVDVTSKQSLVNAYLQSFSFNLDAIRYHNNYDEFYNQNVTFNKAIIYNNSQTSGLLNLTVSNPDTLSQSYDYPKLGEMGYDILVTNSEGMWNFNDFFDVSSNQNNNLPLFTYDCSNSVKELNQKALNYKKRDLNKAVLRSRMCKVRLINDADSQHHFIFNFSITDMQTSVR